MLAAKKGKGSFVDAVTANIYKVVNLINSVAFLALTICSLTNLHDVMQVSINEQYFKNHVPIAVGSFDGTVDSFGCAIGNITAECPLRSFGLHSIQKVLSSLHELFYDKKIGSFHSIAIAYEKTYLCQIVNDSPMILTDCVLFLNIADVLEAAGHAPDPVMNVALSGTNDESMVVVVT